MLHPSHRRVAHSRVALLLVSFVLITTAFTTTTPASALSRPTLLFAGGPTTMEPPTKQRTDTDQDKNLVTKNNDDDSVDYPDLEYLQDYLESRELDDPFHILLLGSTFDQPKITISYVSNSLEYVLDMPRLEAQELSQFAQTVGMSCLGTWPRSECLSLGKQLQRRDLVCRVVPYCEGGQRGWQAKEGAGSLGAANSES